MRKIKYLKRLWPYKRTGIQFTTWQTCFGFTLFYTSKFFLVHAGTETRSARTTTCSPFLVRRWKGFTCCKKRTRIFLSISIFCEGVTCTATAAFLRHHRMCSSMHAYTYIHIYTHLRISPIHLYTIHPFIQSIYNPPQSTRSAFTDSK